MKFSEVMIYFDYNMQEIARALKVSRHTVRKWKERDKIPYSKQCHLHLYTNGKLLANQED
jgi:Mn-dependent DtxR family transcriptional regulator